MRIEKTEAETRRDATKASGKTEKNARFSKLLYEKRRDASSQFNATTEGHEPPSQISSAAEQVAGAAQPTHMEQLASELISHMTAHEVNGAHVLDIQFNSQVLAGLRVNVRSEQGAVAVNFATPVQRIGDLLKSNLDGLRAALEAKGVRVAQLRVSRQNG